MSDSPTSEPESVFVCDCEEDMRSACVGELFYKEHEGKRYCVLHFPSKEKSADFKKALQRKLEDEDFNFRGVWFPNELSLSSFKFNAPADFSSAIFSADVDFTAVTFSEEACFRDATFGATTNFRYATFSSVGDFINANFRRAVDFSGTTFRLMTFSGTTFTESAHFINADF